MVTCAFDLSRHQATKSADSRFFAAVKTLFSMEKWDRFYSLSRLVISPCCVLTMWNVLFLQTIVMNDCIIRGDLANVRVGRHCVIKSRSVIRPPFKKFSKGWFDVKHLYSRWNSLYDLSCLALFLLCVHQRGFLPLAYWGSCVHRGGLCCQRGTDRIIRPHWQELCDCK